MPQLIVESILFDAHYLQLTTLHLLLCTLLLVATCRFIGWLTSSLFSRLVRSLHNVIHPILSYHILNIMIRIVATALLTVQASNTVQARHSFAPKQYKQQLLKLRGGNYEQNPNYAPPTLRDIDSNGYYQSTTFDATPFSNKQRPPPVTELIRQYLSSIHECSPTLSYGTYTSLLLFILWQFAATSPAVNQVLTRHFVCSRRNITKGRYHTLLTSAFSHASFHHLLVNMYAFLTFGPSVTRILASQSIELWSFVVLSAIFGSITFLAWDKRGHGSCIGLSGVTLALLAFDSLVYPSKELRLIVSFIPIHLPAYYLYLGLIGFSIAGLLELLGGRSNNIAHATHLGGLLFGSAYYELFRRGYTRGWNYQVRRAMNVRRR